MKLLYSSAVFILKNEIEYRNANIPTELIELLDIIESSNNTIEFAVDRESTELLSYICKSKDDWNIALAYASVGSKLKIVKYCGAKGGR